MWKCWVTIAQAHHSNLRGMLEYPPSRFPPLHRRFLRFHHLRSFPRFLLLSGSSLYRTLYTFSPSRSIAFCVVSTLVRLSPIFFSRLFSIFLFLLPWKIFPSRFLAKVPLDFAFFSSRLSLADPFLPFHSFLNVLLRAEMPLPLHLHLTIILVLQILLAPRSIRKTFGPWRAS